MPVSYVGAIRSVLNTYPPSKGLFREILQNTEDAKATKQIFVLDHRTTINTHDNPLIVQSPALLAYNDSTFTERDFESLFNLWDSSKKGDTTKIGKFGMGFRSTFHITDTPQVLSESSLAILDPLGHDHQTDRRIDLNSNEMRAETLEPFALDIFQPDVTTAGTNFHGTVVRLPFRAAPSEISNKVFSSEDVRQLLADFIKEEIRIALLFLTNVASIEIYEIAIDGEISCLARSALDRSESILLKNVSAKMRDASYVVLTEESEIDGDVSLLPEPWFILRTSFDSQLASSELSKRLNFDASSALERHKLQPVLAMAIGTSILDEADTMAGRLFTYLPLPLMTNFCVHIHGLFALTPSREKLQNREEIPAFGTDYHISLEWNKLLFDEYLPRAWMYLLSLLAASKIQDIFAAWPPPQKSNQLGDSGYWEKLPENLVAHITQTGCRVWPVFGSAGVFCELGAVLVAGAGEPDRLLDALAATGMKITRPPKAIVNLLRRRRDVKFLAPALVDDLKSGDLTNELPIIMKYLLSTGKMEYIIDLPIFSTTKDQCVAFTRKGTTSIVHVLLEPSEYNLFEACDSDAVALGPLDRDVADLLRRLGTNVLNVQLLSPTTALGYIKHHPGLALAIAGVGDIPVAWISSFWQWISTWHSSHQLYSLVEHLLLLPTQSGLRPTRSPVFESNSMHPLLLSALEKLSVSFVHNAFGQPARLALKTFRKFGDLGNLADFLDSLDLEAVKSFESDEELARQLVSHLGNCTPKQLNDVQRRKMRTLPVFPSHPRTGQGRIRIPDGHTVFGASLRELQFLPTIANTVILSGPQSGIKLGLLQSLDPATRGFVSDLEVLDLALHYFTTQAATTQRGLVEFMASNKSRVPGELYEMLGKTSFVTAENGSKRRPYDLVDPQARLAVLFEAESGFFPRSADLHERRLVDSLRSLGLMQCTLSDDILKGRIQHITSTKDHDCARNLIRVIYSMRYPLPQISEIHHGWIPTPKGLLLPASCRDEPHRQELFDRVLSPLDHALKTDHIFRATFGWDQPIPTEVLALQLLRTLTMAENDIYNVVFSIVKELIGRELSAQDMQHLRETIVGRNWVPVSGNDHRLVMSERAVFFDEDPSAGFYQIVFPGTRSKRFFTLMGCSERPSMSGVIQCLSDLEAQTPSSRVAKKALRLLLLLPTDIMTDADRSRLFIPDNNLKLRPYTSVFYNDIGERAVLVNLDDELHIAHQMIDDSLAKSLRMERLGLKFVDLKPLGIDMGEKLSTTIANKLRNYTHRQVLAEFIANASDAGATEFGIVMDATLPSSSHRVLARSLAEFSDGPSLVLYNNAIFTDDDFVGICQTGVGGKSRRRDTIGQFGFGALTMFHLTDFAMIVSASSVLFLDPSKELLPIRDRATLLLPLTHVKRMYPDHLKPLDGMFDFKVSSTDSYNGSSLGEAWDLLRVQEEIIKPFEVAAEEFLLFTSIRRITISHRTHLDNVCHWDISSNDEEEHHIGEFKSRVFDITISGHRTQTKQSWHIVSTLTPSQMEEPRLLTRYRLRSPVVLALAARVDSENRSIKKLKHAHKFFSTLPLSSGSLPVHLSAPFILSDDRRQIRLDNLDPAASTYNQWLLSTAIPPLYLFLLSNLLQHGYNNAPWWPGDCKEENELTCLVTTSFYKTFLPATHRCVFQHAYEKSTSLSPKEVVLSSYSLRALDRALYLLKPPFASLSLRVVLKALDVGLAPLTPAYLNKFMRHSQVDVTEDLQLDDLNKLLDFLSKDGPDGLVGLCLLPLSSGKFGVMQKASNTPQTHSDAPESVHLLFPENQHLIHPDIAPLVLSRLLQVLNVSKFSGATLKLLLAGVMEEGSSAVLDRGLQAWITTFWETFPDIGVSLADISTFPLVPTKKPGLYMSINHCKDRSAVVLSESFEPAWLWDVLEALGLTIVDRHSTGFPRYLKQFALSGAGFPNITFFQGVLSAMSTAQHTVISRFIQLDARLQRLMAAWCCQKLELGTIPDNLLWIAQRLPIWPVVQVSDSVAYLPANSVTMLPKGIPVDIAGRFMNVSPTIYSAGLVHLRKDALSFSAFFGSLVLPQILPERDVLSYKNLLKMFLNNSRSIPSFETLLVPDSNSVLRHPRELYCRDRLFLAAFNGSPCFILQALADMEPLLVTFGMKREADLDVRTFKSCARALHNAALTTTIDVERARTVFEVYCEALPLRIPSRQQHLWSTLDNLRFIPCDPSRRHSPAPHNLDPSIYAKSLPTIVSPNELILPQFEPIAWTQRAHFLDQPRDRIRIANPALGRPSFPEVVEHLKTLALRVLRDFPSSPRLLGELTQTYAWLDANCNGDVQRLLPTLHAEPLFLNVTDPSTFDNWEWCDADHLLLNETQAVLHYRPVGAFLAPFEKLLRATGVGAVVHSDVPASAEISSDSEQLAAIRTAFVEMRQAGRLTDVEFVAADDDEEEILPCHRAFLATYSSFFYDAFTNEMEEANLDASVRNPKPVSVEDYSSHCVACALDYAYTGTVSDTRSEDIDLMIEVLQLSDFWQMEKLHAEVQRLIVEKRLINLETCPQIEAIAGEYQASFLVQQCQQYRQNNKRLM
ncbi:hypothetical protein DXG01_009887 [Tephrocybe rancida]|nr:hypothetical protein DXG01_009887 [Tephrocybe rancida]